LDEIKELLGEHDAALFAAYYNMTNAGNFEGKNILNVTRELSEVARIENVTVEQLSTTIDNARKILFEAREKRVKPARDEKILTAWNGLMLASFAEAAAILNRPDYAAVAKQNARFVLANLRKDALLLRTYKESQAKLNAYLEDYTFYINGLVTLFETTGELEWFAEARALTETMIAEFWDEQEGGFFYTGRSHEDLIVRSKDFFDNATPSGNSVAADALLRISLLTDNSDYRRRAASILRLTASSVQRYPSGFGRVLCALDFYLGTPQEIAIIGNPSTTETQSLRNQIWNRYLPNKVVAQAPPHDSKAAALIPLLRDRPALNAKPTAYVCKQFVCQKPATTPEELAFQLQNAPTGQLTSDSLIS
jgi:hypothetical protein